jgi:hypothetical protein
MSSQKGKDVIYIDIDDEITAIIDKVRSSHERIVALVLPKRATVFQSVVNMKLLKRTADSAKKHLVLITSETGLLPLAGAVGVHVAKSLQSKPEIPNAPNAHGDDVEEIEESANMADEPLGKDLDESRPIGEYARNAAPSVASPMDDEDDVPIELDNATPAAAAAASKKGGDKKSKKFKIPDFNRFRLLTVLGALGLVLVILFWYVGFVVMPKATIAVKTDSSAVDLNMDLTFNTEAQEADIEAGLLPATAQQVQKTLSQQAGATGEKNNGAKATGTIRFYNCNLADLILGNDRTVKAGTGVSVNGLTYITEEGVTVPPSNFNGNGTTCQKNKPSVPVGMIAQSPGTKYNQAANSGYTVAGSTSMTGSGSATTGGTDDIVKVISQADIDSAKQKIDSQNTDAVKTELQDGLKAKSLYPVAGTFTAGAPEISSSAQVGDEADTVTVTHKITYTMLGAKESDLKRLIADRAHEEIDPQKQSILDYGLTEAVFKLQNQQNANTLSTLETTVIAGSDLDIVEIKKQIAGKKANDAKKLIGEYPGVTEVVVEYSPFWVSSIPKKTSKITITVEVPSARDAKQ